MSFPLGFAWGVATSAYQIEGGWDADGKGVSVWDDMSHNHSERMNNADTGDVACDSYHKVDDDLRIIKELGVSHYRFSVSWSRILPTGEASSLNQKAIVYYNKLINGLLAIGVEPVVSMYHFDLPLSLEKKGGWLEYGIVQSFLDYANVLYTQFGDRVKMWITINEPWLVALAGYDVGIHPPLRRGNIGEGYRAAHNLILAHAAAYRLYEEQFKVHQNGKVGISLNCLWAEPKDANNDADVAAANQALEFELGWFANPIFKDGSYPKIMVDRVAATSKQQNLTASVLPTFTESERKMVAESSDFFGLNFYSTQLCSSIPGSINDEQYETHPLAKLSSPSGGWGFDRAVATFINKDWPSSSIAFLKVVPWGLRKIVCHISEKYGNVPIYVLENGMCDSTGIMQDEHRVAWLREHLKQLHLAINTDKCKVAGYFAWSLMDSLEWCDGYSQKFGLYHVDFNDKSRPRTAKDSTRFYATIIRNNQVE